MSDFLCTNCAEGSGKRCSVAPSSDKPAQRTRWHGDEKGTERAGVRAWPGRSKVWLGAGCVCSSQAHVSPVRASGPVMPSAILRSSCAALIAVVLTACGEPDRRAESPSPLVALAPFAILSSPTEPSLQLSATSAGPTQVQRVNGVDGDSVLLRQVRDAVLNHPELAAGEQRIFGASAAVESARSGLRPRLQVGLDGGLRSGWRGGSFSSSSASGNRSNAFAALRQLMFDGGRTYSQVSSETARLRQTREDRIALAGDLAVRAVHAYLDVRDARVQESLAASDRLEHERLLAMIDERVRAGVAAESDGLLGRSRLADANARLTRASARTSETEAVFAEVFGLPPRDLPPPPRLRLPDDAAARARLADHPRLRGLDASIASLVAATDAARNSALPRLSLEVSARRFDRYSATANGLSNDEVFGGVVMDYDLYSGGAVEASVREAVARLAEVRHRRETTQRELRRVLELALAERAASTNAIAAARLSARANEASLMAAREQFTIGRRSVRELLDIQRERVSALANLNRVETDSVMAEFTIMSLSDGLLPLLGIAQETLRGPALSPWQWP